MECNGDMCVSFLSHSAFVGGSSNAGPFGSSQDLSCFFFQFNDSYAIVSSHLFTTAWPSPPKKISVM